MDANGNMTSTFLNKMFTTKNQVNTNLFDNNDPSGLSQFARIGIRMMAHDMYDGSLDGDIAFRTLLAPDQSGNRPIFQHTAANPLPPEQVEANKDMVRQWGKMDLQDDGKINGSAYAKLIEDVWPTTDHNPIPGFAANLKMKDASLNAAEMFRAVKEVNTPEGLQEFMQKSGLTDKEILNFSLWGHRILDRNFTTQQIASDALSNPRAIDFPLANLSQTNKDYTQSLTNDPNATATVGLGVLNMLIKLSNNLK
ncbi:MAG: hypothetical protein K0Q50_3072 [Vampirovibrio sp.]|nr:hypothetical protein [Vampirovibrio sp.]